MSQPDRREGDSLTTIYVRSFDVSVTEQCIRSLFETYGNVSRIRMQVRRNTSTPGRFAFIEMSDAQATEAIRSLHGSPHGGQVLYMIKSRAARPVSGRRSGPPVSVSADNFENGPLG